MDVSPGMRHKAVRFMSALLSANEIRLTYGYQTLLDGVTLAIAAGEKGGDGGAQWLREDVAPLKILTGEQMADSRKSRCGGHCAWVICRRSSS